MSFDSTNVYIINRFDNLSSILSTDESQDKYCQRWLQHYAKEMKSQCKYKMIDWEIRIWKAIKELYASALLYKEAELAFDNRCMASCYFSLYYSFFHGMLSSLCFDINVSLDEIRNITHSKVGNLFKGTFCNGKNAIISPNIHNTFLQFKYYREYYSYVPPMNLHFHESEHLQIVDDYLTQCFQLTNLQSLLLEKACTNYGKLYRLDYNEDRVYLFESFQKAIALKDIEDNEYILDPTDEIIMNGIQKNGVGGFQCIGLQLDGLYDEIRLYNGASVFFSDKMCGNVIHSFIYQKII